MEKHTKQGAMYKRTAGPIGWGREKAAVGAKHSASSSTQPRSGLSRHSPLSRPASNPVYAIIHRSTLKGPTSLSLLLSPSLSVRWSRGQEDLGEGAGGKEEGD